MCTFVFGTLPANAPVERLKRGFFRFKRIAPGPLASLVQPTEWLGRITSGHCDCGTSLAVSAGKDRAAERQQEGIDHKVDRLRRKGWSRNRIERWVMQVEADRDRHAKAKAEKNAEDAREWREWLRYALEEVRVEHVGLLVDNYDGGFDDAYGDDGKPMPTVRDAGLSDVDERFLENMEKGVLYRVRR